MAKGRIERSILPFVFFVASRGLSRGTVRGMNASALERIVASHDINEHPFYKAWRAGTLPREALTAYASDYGRFIETIADGWTTLGDDAHAETEREHVASWRKFEEKLGASPRTPSPEVSALVSAARAAFSGTATAIGGLYAFEAQQPSTAASKLTGLREHYGFTDADAEYFVLHAGEYGEREKLAGKLEALDEDAVSAAAVACESLCKAMWSALDGCLAAPS